MRLEGGHVTSITLAADEQVRITSIEGPQVVDVWAFNAEDVSEYLSTEHTRSCLEKLMPSAGDILYSNRRRPILTLTEDTSPGIHDLLLSACDSVRYQLLGHTGPHRNCADNLREALAALGHRIKSVPSPFNVFENVHIGPGGSLKIEPPLVRAGDQVTLRAEMNAHVVFSACPMDLALTNGPDGKLRPVEISLL
jgi:uncharacterized protein YcgI (DUF1989 family)